jgi:hypothetical protein
MLAYFQHAVAAGELENAAAFIAHESMPLGDALRLRSTQHDGRYGKAEAQPGNDRSITHTTILVELVSLCVDR